MKNKKNEGEFYFISYVIEGIKFEYQNTIASEHPFVWLARVGKLANNYNKRLYILHYVKLTADEMLAYPLQINKIDETVHL